VSLWFRGDAANLQGRHVLRLSEVFGVPVEELARPLPCFDAETHGQTRATLIWDRVFPDLDDLALALKARDPRAVARLVQVYGLYAAEATLGSWVWGEFPTFKRHIHPVRRRDLEVLWDWHEHRTAA